MPRKQTQILKLNCPHCQKVINLTTETTAKTSKRELEKAARCKYFGSGLEYMPPKERGEALKDIVEILKVDEYKADGIRSTLQRSGVWSFDHLSKTYTGIKWDAEKEGQG